MLNNRFIIYIKSVFERMLSKPKVGCQNYLKNKYKLFYLGKLLLQILEVVAFTVQY